jgi:hypothetical protein
MRKTSLMALTAVASCYSGGDTYGPLAPANPDDHGPRVVWDVNAEPLPEIPFPNDTATRPDGDSPTGRRVNIPAKAKTRHEELLRARLNMLDGFGTYAPIWVRFDNQIDLDALWAVQNDADPDNDAFYLINITKGSPGFGETARLDVGGGRFPLTIENTDQYFPNDPRGAATNLLFDTVGEVDTDGDGELDLDEDTDGDEIFDRPNTWGEAMGDGRTDPVDDLLTFYELATHTLLIRPLVPLRERTTYAMVLTRRLSGTDSEPVQPPFDGINHSGQTPALMPLVEDRLLARHGLELEDVAFTWSFTTQSIHHDLEAIRAGLYGHGTFAELDEAFPPRLEAIQSVDEIGENLHILTTERFLDMLDITLVSEGLGVQPFAKPLLEAAYADNVDYLFFARLEGPQFIVDPGDAFDVDPDSGRISYESGSIYLMCAVPLARGGQAPPFPVAFYGHGYGSSRFETLGFAAGLARFGIATCGIDAFGHGISVDPLIELIIRESFEEVSLNRLADAMLLGRARDVSGDVTPDSGADFWTADSFHTRDVVRQSAIDHVQTIRVLRSFGLGTMPVDVDGDGRDEINGDFNADGVPDIGGETGYYVFGQSLGGILAGVIGPIEPMVLAAVPGSAGGGLVDIGMRTSLSGVIRSVLMPAMSTLVSNQLSPDLEMEVGFTVRDLNISPGGFEERFIPFANLDSLVAGDRVQLVNLRNDEEDWAYVQPPLAAEPLRFRLQIPTDAGDPLELNLFHAGDSEPYQSVTTVELDELEDKGFHGKKFPMGSELVALEDGFGLKRNTPDFRRLFSAAQLVLDRADPAVYAPYFHQPYHARPEGAVGTNLLVITTTGDLGVPVNTGAAIARSAGVIGLEPSPLYGGRSPDQMLVDTWVLEGVERFQRFADDPCYLLPGNLLFDIDEHSRGTDSFQGPHLSEPTCDGSPTAPPECTTTCAPMPPLRATVTTPHGMSGARFLFVTDNGGPNDGNHGFALPNPNLDFDYHQFQINQIGWFFKTNGQVISDDPCLADSSCEFMQ